MILLFLASIITAAAAAPSASSSDASSSRRVFGPAPTVTEAQACRFGVASRHYDICPIIDGLALQRLNKGPESSSDVAMISGSSSGSVECPPQTLCLAHQFSSNIRLDTKDSEETIILDLSDSGSESKITLTCDSSAGLGEPAYLTTEESVRLFSWRTKYACPLPGPLTSSVHAMDGESEDSDVPPGDAPPNPPADDSSDSPPPPPPPADDSDSDQLLGKKERNSRRAVAITFSVIFFLVVFIAVLSYKRPPWLTTIFEERIQPLFRRLPSALQHLSLPRISLKPAGEGRLVRWAHEDLELDTDLMVNGGDGFEDADDLADEYIPLRPSPRKGQTSSRRVKNYGTEPPSPFW